MSQAHVEVVRRALDAYNPRDLAIYDDLYRADCEGFAALMRIVDSESFRGREGAARYYGLVGDTWEEFRIAGEEFRDLGETVLGRIRVGPRALDLRGDRTRRLQPGRLGRIPRSSTSLSMGPSPGEPPGWSVWRR